MHDLNNDTMLDGLEILSALTHMLPYEELYAKSGGEEEEESKKQFKTPEELKAAAEKKHDEAMDYYTSEFRRISLMLWALDCHNLFTIQAHQI